LFLCRLPLVVLRAEICRSLLLYVLFKNRFLQDNKLVGEIPGSLLNAELAYCDLQGNPGLCKSRGASSKVAAMCDSKSVALCDAVEVPFQTPLAADACDTGLTRYNIVAQKEETITGSCIPKKRCNEEGRQSVVRKCMKKGQKYDICCYNLGF
jgi:hypothetical protein